MNAVVQFVVANAFQPTMAYCRPTDLLAPFFSRTAVNGAQYLATEAVLEDCQDVPETGVCTAIGFSAGFEAFDA